MRGALAALLTVCVATPAFSARLPASTELKRMTDYCYNSKSSMVESRNCMSGHEERLRRELARSVRKRFFEIDEVAKKSPDDGIPNGKEDADRWRKSFEVEQEAWARYEKYRCENVVNFENAGGSGAGGFATNCSIRLILERLRELDDGY